MDEPFGALDEMTRERMNDEVLRIWERTGTTIVFVTHSIPEAVYLSTRVVVMSARPGRITAVVDIDLPRPRDVLTRESERYFALVTEVRELLRTGTATEVTTRLGVTHPRGSWSVSPLTPTSPRHRLRVGSERRRCPAVGWGCGPAWGRMLRAPRASPGAPDGVGRPW